MGRLGRTYESQGRHRLETNLAPFTRHSRGDAADARPMPGICASTRLLNGETHTRSQERDDDAIATLAFHQEGIIARKQLLEIRIGRRAISNRLRNGRLRHQHPGVYAVGHEALTFKAKTVAAALSVAPDVATTHWTSGAHWEVCKPGNGPIHMTCPLARRPRPGILIHRAPLPSVDVTVRNGIPMATIERTILDLAGCTSRARVRRIVKNAEFLRLTDHASLAAAIDRHPEVPGSRTLADLLGSSFLDDRRTRSDLEDDFLFFCRARGLPLPETNVVVEIADRLYEVDCLWRHERLAVELDGRDAHSTDLTFDEDRARDRALTAAGWSPMRVTSTHIERDAELLEAEIRAVLAARTPHR